MQREWFYIETSFDGKRMLVQIPYRTQRDAEQAAMRQANSGAFNILSYPTRDKRVVWQQWKSAQSQNNY